MRLARRHIILGLVIGWFLPVPFMLLGITLQSNVFIPAPKMHV